MKTHANLTSTAEWHFDPSPGQLPAARHTLRDWLYGIGFTGKAAEDAILVASELISNGVLHDGGGEIVLRAELEPGQLCLEVVTIDHPPGARPPWLELLRDPLEGGLGLQIVEALTCHLAIDTDGASRRVSCAFPVKVPGGEKLRPNSV
ncbi:MAG TPA: ATP-binding protein [Actinomycetota bacterium]|nr:ATP-binding protein [Actinomycetota bacterium]